MTTRRWWDVAFAAALAMLAVLSWTNTNFGTTAQVGAIATLAVIGAFYAGYGRRAFASVKGRSLDQPAAADSNASTAETWLLVVVVVGAGVATMFHPSMATFQALAFPLIWALTDGYLRSVVGSGVLAVSVSIGLYIVLGADGDALLTTAVIQVISFTFAVALGTWISRIANEGERQRRLFQELAATQDELATMHREVGTVTERERLAREIHDTIAQSLTSLVMLAQKSHRELAVIPSVFTAQATETVDLIESTARDALTEARSLVASMAAVGGENSSLADTVARLGERFEKETGIRVSVSVAVSGLGRELEVVLLRCTQEGLANVRKHSRATGASVRITRNRFEQEVTLEVRDDGCGIGALSDHAQTNSTGFGIAGMRDRVALVGGRLAVTGSSGLGNEVGGTVLRVVVPAPVSMAGVQP